MKNRRLLKITSLIAGIFFLSGLLFSTQLPKLRSWILVKVEQTSQENLPVRILPESIEVSLFPVGVRFRSLKILPKPEISDVFQSAKIDDLIISVSHWQLFNGRLRITDLIVNGAEINAQIPKPKKTEGPLLDGLFNLVGMVPIEHLELNDIRSHLKIKHLNTEVDISDLSLEAEKQSGGVISVSLTSGNVQLKADHQDQGLRFEAEGTLSATRKKVQINGLKLRRGDSFLAIDGKMDGDTESLKFANINATLTSGLLLDSIYKLARRALPQETQKVPELKGRAEASAKVIRRNGKDPEIDFKLGTQGLRVGKMNFDRIEGSGKYKDLSIAAPQILLSNKAGRLEVKDFLFALNEQKSFSGVVQTERLNTHELMIELGVGKIPVYMDLLGGLPCKGSIKERFDLKCTGKLRAEKLLVQDSIDKPSTLVALPEFTAEGDVHVDHEKVTYSAELAMPNSKGRSNGVISYETGFKISYEADQLSFADASNLVNLKLEGLARVKGSTEGDSHHATLAMDVEGTSFWFEDFWLGNVKTKLQYKNGELGFSNVQGHYAVSRYNADVKLNVLTNQISMNARVPFYDARDLSKVLSRRVPLPIEIAGTGQAQVNVSGPLDISRLSYELKSSLYRGSAAGETFEEAFFDITSKNGEVKADRVRVRKGNSAIVATGTAQPNGTINALIQGKGINLEDSALVGSTGLAFGGMIDFDMKMTGQILEPDTELVGKLYQTSIGDQGVPDSNFKLKFTPNTVEGDGNFLGDLIKASVILPINAQAPFALKLKSQDWNFAPLFAAISGPGSRRDYEGRLTADIDISSEQGGFWNATGSAKFSKFSLSRGSVALANREPVTVNMKNGQVLVDKFILDGDNIFLKITDAPNPASKLDLQVNGKVDLTLVALLTPFFEDLRGIVSFAFNLRAGPPGATTLLGSAYIERGYLKFFDFPHPIEDARVDVVFNQRKILINALKAELGGGQVVASGDLDMKGPKDYPVNLSGSFENITLEVPPKVKTTGSGNISLTGNWFPFSLKAKYITREGLITMDLGGDGGKDKAGVRRDFFLPELLLKDNFTPITLDLDIDFSRGLEMKNELIEGKVGGNLSVSGPPSKLAILGTISSERDTKIFFRDTAFEVTNSNIQFTDPKAINPKLYVAAQARVQDYDINLLVQGTGNRPEINLTSVPELAERDIISLLALGATDAQLATNIRSQEQASSTGLQIGTGMIKNNPLSKEIKNRLGVDVQFSAGFDDTAATQKIIVSKQFNQKLDVSGSRSLGKTQNTEAKVRYRLSDRVSLIGSWQGREYEDAKENEDLNRDQIGLDVEYKFEFK